MSDQHPVFTEEEVKYLVNKWKLWKGIAIGFVVAMILFALIGLFVS